MKENLLLKKILLKIFNRISADNNYLKIESIHFKNNYLRIEGNENSLQCEKQSFLRNSHVYIKGMENRISIDIETEVYGNNMQVLFVNGSNNQILIGKNCVIRDTTFFINGNNNVICLENNVSVYGAEFHIEQDNNRNDMPAFMDTDLDLYTLVHDIVSNWWVIILGAIAGALLTYVVVSSRYVPEYTTQATFVVASRGDANAYSNLSSANTMAKTFEKILKSNIMEKKICEKLKVEELDADIHAKVLEGTNMLVLSVTADTPKDSIDIIRTVMDNYSSVSLYTVGSAVMDVLEEPKIPYTPDNPLDAGRQAKKGGLVAGALVLILLGMFSYMKNTIKQENEIEKKLDARSLGAISYEWKYKTIRDIFRRKKKAILVDDPVASFRFVESYKKLAAKVEYRMAKNEQKVLVVTSVSENEGKSTVAANLAITLAEQSKRVLLVDGDIRRPSQFLIFGMEPKEENELGEYLRGNGSLADVMVPCTRKHMLFMGGKNCYSSSTEMLNSDSFYKLMTACRKFVDYVIIDTPPAGIIGDAQIFAHCADAVMIVAKQNYMLAEDINEVMDAFRDKEGKVLGVVLNGVRSFSGLVDSPVGHYYGKYSKYGRYGNYGRSKGM